MSRLKGKGPVKFPRGSSRWRGYRGVAAFSTKNRVTAEFAEESAETVVPAAAPHGGQAHGGEGGRPHPRGRGGPQQGR
ncbi:hypothetical protein GA0115249_12141, partial [Streptomyces sp. PpalLS-921]